MRPGALNVTSAAVEAELGGDPAFPARQASAPRLPWLSVLLSALSAPLPPFRILLLCNCCPQQLHPLRLQHWTEEGINHIFEEDTLLFISLTLPAMGCPGRPTAH